MLARVVTIHVRPDRMDECIAIFRDVNAPSIARRGGFGHGHWWVDRDTGEAVSVTFWDTAEQEHASRAHIPALVQGMAPVLANLDVQQRIYEGVHDQQPV